jgi:hypothetical protein
MKDSAPPFTAQRRSPAAPAAPRKTVTYIGSNGQRRGAWRGLRRSLLGRYEQITISRPMKAKSRPTTPPRTAPTTRGQAAQAARRPLRRVSGHQPALYGLYGRCSASCPSSSPPRATAG